MPRRRFCKSRKAIISGRRLCQRQTVLISARLCEKRDIAPAEKRKILDFKQYYKEGCALRTETTVNNPNDFGLPKGLSGLPPPRAFGFAANRRLMGVRRLSHDCAVGEAAFRQVNRLVVVVGAQRASALRFADPRVQTLLSALVLFRLLPTGFSNTELRAHLAPLLGLPPASSPKVA